MLSGKEISNLLKKIENISCMNLKDKNQKNLENSNPLDETYIRRSYRKAESEHTCFSFRVGSFEASSVLRSEQMYVVKFADAKG